MYNIEYNWSYSVSRFKKRKVIKRKELYIHTYTILYKTPFYTKARSHFVIFKAIQQSSSDHCITLNLYGLIYLKCFFFKYFSVIQ